MKKVQSSHKPVSDAGKSSSDSPIKNSMIPVIIIAVLVGVFLLLKLFRGGNPDMGTMKTKIIPEVVKKVVNNPATKFEIMNAKETNGLVEFELQVAGQKYISYISRDGKILFTTGIKIDDLNKSAASASAKSSKPATCADLPKAENANLTAYVVADCPYGLQMQRVFKKALAEAPGLSSYLNIKYIGSVDGGKITSMHGDKEAQENLKQICIREEQKNLFWPYLSCYMQEGKTEDCLASTGINSAELSACTSDSKRGLKYAQADFEMANKFGVSGSPTLLLNNKQTVSEFDFGGRNPNAIKELVCCGSKVKPEFCSADISKNDVAVSLSKTDEAAAGAAAGTAAGCAPAQ